MTARTPTESAPTRTSTFLRLAAKGPSLQRAVVGGRVSARRWQEQAAWRQAADAARAPGRAVQGARLLRMAMYSTHWVVPRSTVRWGLATDCARGGGRGGGAQAAAQRGQPPWAAAGARAPRTLVSMQVEPSPSTARVAFWA